MKIELSCAACGGNGFDLDQDRADDCLIKCGDCGHEVGTLAELKERVADSVMKMVQSRKAAVGRT